MGWVRRTRTTALVVVLLLCVICVAFFVFDVIQLARAKALVAAVESLRIGFSWKEQSSAGVFQEQTCDKGICREEKIISNLPLVDSWRHRPADMPSFFHGRWWAVAATV